jgi:RNA polymerase sigma-19 factor, ECF subfamily
MTVAQLAAQQVVQTLYREHHGWLQSLLRKRLGNTADAADLAHDTFVNVMSSGTAGQIREPRPFLVTVARRLLANRHRRQLLEEAYLEALAQAPAPTAPSPEAHWQALEALHQLELALDALPPPVREAFLLAHLEELSYDEIATRLNVSSSSVKQYLSRANRQCLFALAA